MRQSKPPGHDDKADTDSGRGDVTYTSLKIKAVCLEDLAGLED
jgi:hypothetical protein